MIECPNCGHMELPGALYCNECGTQLVLTSRDLTVTIPGTLASALHDDEVGESVMDVPPTPGDATLSLFIVDTGEVIQLEGLSEYTLGRSAEDQPILPDVDLEPYHAYEYGVSRLHASIKLSQQRALLTDFDSANGTQLNGQKLSPHKPYPVTHGDIITLGSMKIQLLVNR